MSELWFIPIAVIWAFAGSYIWYKIKWKTVDRGNVYLLCFGVLTIAASMHLGTKWNILSLSLVSFFSS